MFANTVRRSAQRALAVQNLAKMVKVQRTPIMSSVASQSLLLSQSQRTFSSFELVERATQKLNKALESEIKYESENYT